MSSATEGGDDTLGILITVVDLLTLTLRLEQELWSSKSIVQSIARHGLEGFL